MSYNSAVRGILKRSVKYMNSYLSDWKEIAEQNFAYTEISPKQNLVCFRRKNFYFNLLLLTIIEEKFCVMSISLVFAFQFAVCMKCCCHNWRYLIE